MRHQSMHLYLYIYVLHDFIMFLQAVEAVSVHCVTGASAYSLSVSTFEKMVRVLETESHEGTLVAALSALTSWATKFTTDIPQKLLDFIPVSQCQTFAVVLPLFIFPYSCVLICMYSALTVSHSYDFLWQMHLSSCQISPRPRLHGATIGTLHQAQCSPNQYIDNLQRV